MRNFRIFLTVVVFIFVYSSAMAQFSSSGSDTYFSGGNVGIGTSTPSTLLELYMNGTPAYLSIRGAYAGTASPRQNLAAIRLYDDLSDDQVYFGLRKIGDSHDMIQSVYDASNDTWREFIAFDFETQKYEIRFGVGDTEFKNSGDVLFNNTGNVGIGTSTLADGYKLSVDGNIICEELQVVLSENWPDYVFDADYELSTLSEVESFIVNNGHLPGIPSAKEVKEQGVPVGEMNAKLLEKVEELTLYIIDLKKEIDTLKAK